MSTFREFTIATEPGDGYAIPTSQLESYLDGTLGDPVLEDLIRREVEIRHRRVLAALS